MQSIANPILTELDSSVIDQLLANYTISQLDEVDIGGDDSFIRFDDMWIEVLFIDGHYVAGYVFWKDDLDRDLFCPIFLPFSIQSPG